LQLMHETQKTSRSSAIFNSSRKASTAALLVVGFFANFFDGKQVSAYY
jgi:hypothetical protein